MKFVHLHVHSYFSLLDGVSSPEKLVQYARYFKMPALALTDHNNLYGAVKFYRNAKEMSIKPIIGAELSFKDFGNIVFLVKNSEGYRNLSELITRGHLRKGHGKFVLYIDDLIKHKEGLFILIGGRKNILFENISQKKIDQAFDILRKLASIFGSSLYLELQQISPSDIVLNRRYMDFAHTLQIPLVATNNVHFVKKEDWKIHQVLKAIEQKSALTVATGILPAECYFKSSGEMIDLFSYFPEALQNTVFIADKCNFEFSLGKFFFPATFSGKEKSSFSILAEKVKEGLIRRYGEHIPEKVKIRARKELKLIREMGFSDYFLIVEDIVRFCREHQIPCVGRGSAGDSLVAYSLDITQVDPIRYNLYFERFLNRGRKELPDIDLDICWKNRDRVLEYVYNRFGREKTAMICTFNTFKLRSSIRDVAKVFGMPEEEIKLLTSYLPHFSRAGLRKILETLPEFQHLRHQFSIYEEIFDLSEAIKDLPRHLSIHAGGMVIAPEKITRFVPLEEAGKGLVITQFDMYDIEALGLIKMDLLGVRSLSIISDVVNAVHQLREKGCLTISHRDNKNKGPDLLPLFQCVENKRDKSARTQEYVYELNSVTGKIVKRQRRRYITSEKFPFLFAHSSSQYSILDLKMIPENDPTVIEMLRNGFSLGCFQLESPGMRGLLKKLQMESMDDVIISVALIRPGAANSGMKETYIKRRAGKIPVTYLHPSLEKILQDTLGVVIYQEQVMQIAHQVAGLSLENADYLRRAMTKHRNKKEIMQLRQKFIEGVRNKGFSNAAASKLWQFLLNFTGYGFNKAHASTYGILAYQSAFLKKYFPVIFMTAVLNNEGGFYSRMAYVEEARRMGIRILPPDVLFAEEDFTFFENSIRLGLKTVYELSYNTILKILMEREKKEFTSVLDFLKRVKPARNEAINLAKCGALRSLCSSEPQAILQINLFYQKGRQSMLQEEEMGIPELPPYTIQQRVFFEMEILGCAVSAHPLILFKHAIPEESIPSYRLDQYKNKEITFCGWAVTSRTTQTAEGKTIKFISLEDFYGLVEVVCWEDVYKRYAHLLKDNGPFIVKGMLQSRVPGELNLIAKEVHKIEFTKEEWEQIMKAKTSSIYEE